MCVYECTEKPFDGWVETLVKHEVHRYLSTSEWINAALSSLEEVDLRLKEGVCKHFVWIIIFGSQKIILSTK